VALSRRETHSNKSFTRSHSSLLDVSILDPQRNSRKNLKSLLAFHLVRIRRKNHSSLGKMGPPSKTKSSRRMGSKKHFAILKSFGSQNRLEAHQHK
jgi:hypothetical protein